MLSKRRTRKHLTLDKEVADWLETVKKRHGWSCSYTLNLALRYWMEITGDSLNVEGGPEYQARIRVEDLPAARETTGGGV